MGTVFRKTVTKALPACAEIFLKSGMRHARWKDSRGKHRTAKLTSGKDGTERIIFEARTFTAKYRDGSGQIVIRPTGCKDETAARRMLADWERRAELVKANVVTAAEDSIADHQRTPIEDHFDAFSEHQTAKGVVPRRVKDVRSQLRRAATDCGFRQLADLDPASLERWLNLQRSKGMSAGTSNEYRGAFVAFANWCVRSRRLNQNPFANVPKADQKSDRRRRRRALSEGELLRLLDVARRRPLQEAATVRRGKRKGETFADLRPETVERLERLGWERGLIYKTLVLTGLRLNELRTLTIGQLTLGGEFPRIELDAADEKNRQGNTIPLRGDLAADLAEWIESKRECDCGATGSVQWGQNPDVLKMTHPFRNFRDRLHCSTFQPE